MMKSKFVLVLILVLLFVGIVGTVTTNAAQRPMPPTIQTFGIPNPVGYTPDCGPEPETTVSCGVICYYTDTLPPGLSCLPAWFLE
jgi:hypothetical protein